jgi:hypothetical protein
MKRNFPLLATAFIASALGYSGSAHSDDITIAPSPFVSSVSRAEVRAELDAFKTSGINPWATHYDLLRNFKSRKTRAQVTAEYLGERDAIASMNGEDSGSRYLSEHRHTAPAPVHLATDRPNIARP